MRVRSSGLAVSTLSLVLLTGVFASAKTNPAGTKGKAAASPAATPAASAASVTATTAGTAAANAATASTSSSGSAVPDGMLSAKDALGEDVLDRMLAWNSAKYAAPASTFRPAGVHPLKVDRKTVANVGGGFRVRFASSTQVTTPAVYQGMLFVSGGFSSHELYSFDAKTGKPVWALQLDDDGPSAPACADGVCVVNTESCTLFVVEAKTGKLLWAKYLGDPLMSAPTIAHGKVFASYPVTGVAPGKKSRPSGATHALAAFDLKSGKLLWQKWIDGDVMSAPVAVDEKIWAATFSGTVYEMDQASGQILSAHRARATSAPVVVAGNLYFSARADGADGRAGEALVGYGGYGAGASGKGHAWVAARKEAKYLDDGVQASSGYVAEGKAEDSNNGFGGGAPATANAAPAASLVGQASVSTLQAHQGSRIVSVGDMNVSTMGDEVVATRAKNGKKLWSVKMKGDVAKAGGFLATPPVAAGDSILVGTVEGEVLRINAKTGAVVKRWKVGAPLRAQPVVEDGWIYAGTADGRLIAIDTGDKSLTGWSQWGGDETRASVKKK